MNRRTLLKTLCGALLCQFSGPKRSIYDGWTIELRKPRIPPPSPCDHADWDYNTQRCRDCRDTRMENTRIEIVSKNGRITFCTGANVPPWKPQTTGQAKRLLE